MHRLLIEQAASKLAFALVTLVGSVCAHVESSLVAIWADEVAVLVAMTLKHLFSPCGIAKHAFACCAPVAARRQCLLPSIIAFNSMFAEEWVFLRYLGKRMRGDRLAIVHAADASRPLSLRSHFLIQVASVVDAEVDSATHPFCFALQIPGSA